MSDSLQSHGLQHIRLPCLSPSPGSLSNSCLLSWWCHQTISFSVVPFSSFLQYSPPSGSFPRSQLFASGGQSIGVSSQYPSYSLRMTVGSWYCLQTPNSMPFFFIFPSLGNNNPMTHPFAQVPGHFPHKIFSKSLCSSIKGHLHFAFPLGQCFAKLTLLQNFALNVYLLYHYLLFIVA